MKRIVAVFLALIMLTSLNIPSATAETLSYSLNSYNTTKTLYTGLVNPRALAIGNNGELYILDGLVLKKYHNGQMITLASMLNSREYFKPYNLGEVEDIQSFRPGSMVYLDGALYVAGLIVDRCTPPKYRGEWNNAWRNYTSVYLGDAMPIVIKITDHFEPLIVDYESRRDLNLSPQEYQALMLNDPAYTKSWIYWDYTTRFRNLMIPNLAPSPDGALYVIKQTALKASGNWYYQDERRWRIITVYTDNRIGRLAEKYKDLTESKIGRDEALYKIWPDGKQEILDEGVIVWGEELPNQGTLASFIGVFNKQLQDVNDPYPDVNLRYAVPSETDPANSVIVTNGCYVWKYNFKNLTYEQLVLMPGNEMPTGNRTALMPDAHYSPTMPRTTKTLGTFFLGRGAVWRLYADRYYQDLGGPKGISVPWIDTTADWQVDEDNRMIYYLTRDGALKAVDFSHLIPKTQAQSNYQAPGNTFKVILDKNRDSIYGVNGPLGPYYEGNRLYVPIDPIVYMLDVSLLENQMTWTDSKTALVPLRYDRTNFKIYIKVRASKTGSIVQKHADIDELLQVVYELTGHRYSWRYDRPTNTLYLESGAGSIKLFDGNTWW